MFSEKQALHAMSPSNDFREAVDTDRLTKAVYIAETAGGVSFEVHNEVTDSDVTFITGGAYHPIRTSTTITLSGYTIVYLY